MRKAYLDLPYGQMHYRYAGEGTPIILLHMSGSSSDEYEKVGDILTSKGYQVFAPDFMGFGGSDRPDHYFSFPEHAASIKAFSDALQIRSACIAGNLVGADVAAHIAVSYPELVKKVVMFHICDPELYAAFRETAFSVIPITEDGSHMMTMWKRSHKYGDPPEISNARCINLHKAADWGEALHWALTEDAPFGTYLPQLACKAKVFAYPAMEHETTKKAAEMMQNCEYELLEKATPYFSRSSPEEYVEKILEVFLD
ncbi:MAG: alpha/beta fold hydrolase [Anaerolineaceae bacterium]|nr:alpha/beta fold hydrolase [Anaerolineaceae bacterium]